MMLMYTLLTFAQDTAPLEDIRGLKPAIEVASEPVLWPWVLGTALLGIAGVVATAWWRRRSTPVSPEETFRLELSKADTLLDAGDATAHADAVIAAVRGFVAATTEIPALHLTTEELLRALSDVLPVDTHQGLGDFFERCDTLRFAGFSATDTVFERPWLEAFITALTGLPAQVDRCLDAPSTPLAEAVSSN